MPRPAAPHAPHVFLQLWCMKAGLASHSPAAFQLSHSGVGCASTQGTDEISCVFGASPQIPQLLAQCLAIQSTFLSHSPWSAQTPQSLSRSAQAGAAFTATSIACAGVPEVTSTPILVGSRPCRLKSFCRGASRAFGSQRSMTCIVCIRTEHSVHHS